MARDPESATVEVDLPADFDEFWAETLRLTDEVPPDPELVRVPRMSTPTVDVFELRYTSYDQLRIAAWLTMPAGRPPGTSFPAVLHVPGYISEPSVLKSWSERGYVTVGLAPRGKLRSNARFNPGYPGLLTHNMVDRFTYGYRGFYADVVRAVDVLATLPGVDPGRVGIWGSSQGGGLGIVAAALRPDVVRCVAAGAPYLCGIMASPGWTHSYPYEEINEYLRVHPEHEPLLTETASYFDGLNFAPKVRAPIFVYLGMEDDVCPPETGFAVYRLIESEKELHTYPRCGHDSGLRWVIPLVEKFVDSHLHPEGVGA